MTIFKYLLNKSFRLVHPHLPYPIPHTVPVSTVVRSTDTQSPGPKESCMLEQDQDATISPGVPVFCESKSGYIGWKETGLDLTARSETAEVYHCSASATLSHDCKGSLLQCTTCS